MIESKAVVPAQPDLPRYPLSALALTRLYDRAEYEAAFGMQPPPFDPTRPIKRWVITDAVIGPTTYLFWDGKSQSIGKFVASKQGAAAVNISGAYRYPKWVNDPESSARVQSDAGVQPINGLSLVRPEDAELVATELRRDLNDITIQAVQTNPGSGPFRVLWNTETRRRFVIIVGGIARMAESLVSQRYERGVGHPGKWIMDGAEPRFVPAQVATEPPPNAEEIPVPLRALLPNERIEVSPFAGPVVVRADMESAPAGSDGDRLAAIEAKLDKLVRYFEL